MAETDFPAELADLRDTLRRITEVIDLEALRAEVADLEQQAADPNLWDNQENAQRVNSQLSHKQAHLDRVDRLGGRIEDVEIMAQMAAEEADEDTRAEAVNELAGIRKALDSLEVVTLMSGEYDERDAVVTIRSGAGEWTRQTSPKCCCGCTPAGPRRENGTSKSWTPPTPKKPD